VYKEIVVRTWVTANGYTTKEVRELDVDGWRQSWNLMKRSPLAMVFFRTEGSQWLKVASGGFEQRVRASLPPQRAALELSNLGDYGRRCSLAQVSCPKEEISGCVGLRMPHLGPTVEFLKKNGWPADYLSDCYYQAWLLGRRLLKEAGWWTEDTNPGNVVIGPKDRVTLIDFCSVSVRRRDSEPNVDLLEEKFLREAVKIGLRDWRQRKVY